MIDELVREQSYTFEKPEDEEDVKGENLPKSIIGQIQGDVSIGILRGHTIVDAK